jgi:hypothetical protein
MPDNPVAEQAPRDPASLQVLEAQTEPATVIVGRPGDDYADVITYRDGKFTHTVTATRSGIPIPHIAYTLQQEELRPLLDTLLGQLIHPPTAHNLDLSALKAFIGILGPQVWSGHTPISKGTS